ncbi:MAG: site-2 protease family protein [Candidatus Wallbacteria bacterium]|nr:site-2 protease family protein [Candidatus Wallbacteria bacterium]
MDNRQNIIRIGIVFLVLIILNNLLKNGLEGVLSGILNFTLLAIPGVFAIVLHEFAHGYVSFKLGDPLPKISGRLSLNPLRHLDPLGTIMIFIVSIGWAKPVLIDPRYYKNRRLGEFLVALAGPATNLALAILSAIPLFYLPREASIFFTILGKILMFSFQINTALTVFNLLPIPPLDGSKLLYFFLPDSSADVLRQYEMYGAIFMVVLVVTGYFERFLSPLLGYAQQGIIWLLSRFLLNLN